MKKVDDFFLNLERYISENQEIERDIFHFNDIYNEYLFNQKKTIYFEEKDTAIIKENLLYEKVNNCYKCYLGKSRTKSVYFGYLDKDIQYPYVFLLDIPTMADNIQGSFYSENPVSMMYKNILKALGLDYRRVYTTSSIKCYSSMELPNDLSLIHVCKNYLEEEMKQVEPKLIFAFGEHTYRFLMEDNDFQNNRGKKLKWMNYDIIFTDHPQKAVTDKRYKKYIWEDIKDYVKEIEDVFREK